MRNPVFASIKSKCLVVGSIHFCIFIFSACLERQTTLTSVSTPGPSLPVPVEGPNSPSGEFSPTFQVGGIGLGSPGPQSTFSVLNTQAPNPAAAYYNFNPFLEDVVPLYQNNNLLTTITLPSPDNTTFLYPQTLVASGNGSNLCVPTSIAMILSGVYNAILNAHPGSTQSQILTPTGANDLNWSIFSGDSSNYTSAENTTLYSQIASVTEWLGGTSVVASGTPAGSIGGVLPGKVNDFSMGPVLGGIVGSAVSNVPALPVTSAQNVNVMFAGFLNGTGIALEPAPSVAPSVSLSSATVNLTSLPKAANLILVVGNYYVDGFYFDESSSGCPAPSGYTQPSGPNQSYYACGGHAIVLTGYNYSPQGFIYFYGYNPLDTAAAGLGEQSDFLISAVSNPFSPGNYYIQDVTATSPGASLTSFNGLGGYEYFIVEELYFISAPI